MGLKTQQAVELGVIERSLNNTETFELPLTSLAFIALKFLLGNFPLNSSR